MRNVFQSLVVASREVFALRKLSIIAIVFLTVTGAKGQSLMGSEGSSNEKKEVGLDTRKETKGDLDEFGLSIFKVFQSGNPEGLTEYLFQRDELIETINKQTTNSELIERISQQLDDGFDEKIRLENSERFTSLMKNESIDWRKATFEKFKFIKDESQTERLNIVSGSGYIRFSYEGRNYQVLIDKVSRLVSGWRGNEIGTRAELVYKNQ
ncbi:MAG: hypothetical protein RIF46_14260 [Cyclobacteriaceae bacterium]